MFSLQYTKKEIAALEAQAAELEQRARRLRWEANVLIPHIRTLLDYPVQNPKHGEAASTVKRWLDGDGEFPREALERVLFETYGGGEEGWCHFYDNPALVEAGRIVQHWLMEEAR
jgi:hypothetical protein